MTTETNKKTLLYRAISITAILWNLLGVMAYLGQVYLTVEAKALLPKAYQDYYAHVPAWVTAAFAISVFAGFLGSIALLLRKKIAISLLILSLIAVLVQATYNFLIQSDMPITATAAGMPIMIILVSIFLVWYAKKELGK